MPTDLEPIAPDAARLAQHTAGLRAHLLADVVGRLEARPRRRLVPVAAVAAVTVAALAVGSTVLLHGRPSPAQRAYDVAAPGSAYLTYGAFSVGSTLFIGNHRVHFAEKVKSLYYTSAGVVVRHGTKPVLDDAGPSRYTLVRPDGSRKDLRLDLGDRVPGTSPRTPYLAYAAPGATPTQWRLVLVDVRTGAQVAATDITGAFTWGGWVAPPVATDGGRVWALLDAGWTEWTAATGSVREVPRSQDADTPLAAAGGRYVEERPGRIDIRDFASGRLVAAHSVDAGETRTIDDIAPDGRASRYGETYTGYDEKGHLTSPPRGGRLVDLDSGAVSQLAVGPWGWTPDGSALKVDAAGDRVTICSPATGHCRSVHEVVPAGRVKLGGATYES